MAEPAALERISATDLLAVDQYPGHENINFAYPKTATALYYDTPDAPPLWGWEAVVAAAQNKYEPWQYQTRFKLRLAQPRFDDAAGAADEIPPLPPGKTTIQVIADYLHLISAFALEYMSRRTPQPLTNRDIKWCLTIPAIWSMAARTAMHTAAKQAGMVRGDGPDNGGSPFDLLLVLEPEAASIYCLNKVAIDHAAKALYVCV